MRAFDIYDGISGERVSERANKWTSKWETERANDGESRQMTEGLR